jgi:hypothetical protein
VVVVVTQKAFSSLSRYVAKASVVADPSLFCFTHAVEPSFPQIAKQICCAATAP